MVPFVGWVKLIVAVCPTLLRVVIYGANGCPVTLKEILFDLLLPLPVLLVE